MPTNGFILIRLSDNAPVESFDTTTGVCTFCTNPNDAQFDTVQTVVDGWRDFVNSKVPSSQVVGTHPIKRYP